MSHLRGKEVVDWYEAHDQRTHNPSLQPIAGPWPAPGELVVMR